MWWRLKRAEFTAMGSAGRRAAMKELVEGGVVPGLLGYLDGRAVAWCSVAPREQFGRLNRSPVLRPLDNHPVWSIVCFFIHPDYQGRGLLRFMLDGAIEYVRGQGGRVIEAYPDQPRDKPRPPDQMYMGVPGVYARAGFVEVARPSRAKLIMRRYLDDNDSALLLGGA
jgi:GNAT superfamily N-acetyltransferase